MKYWINTVSCDHLKNGLADGFTQANLGRRINLQRLLKGDLIVFYSPRTYFRGGDLLQQFLPLPGLPMKSHIRYKCVRTSIPGAGG